MITIKRVVGILILSIVFFSVGTIYAKVDPAAKLSNWYNHSFQRESEKVETILAVGMRTSVKQLGVFIVESKNQVDASIQSFRDNQVTEVEASINKYLGDMKNRLYETVANLKEDDLDDYVDKEKIDEEIEQNTEKVLKEVLEE